MKAIISLIPNLVGASIVFVIFSFIGTLILIIADEITITHGIFACLFIICGLLAFPWQIMDIGKREYIFNDESMIFKYGIITRYEIEMSYSNIIAVSVKQGLLNRISGCAEIRAISPGGSSIEQTLVFSSNANTVCVHSVINFEEITNFLKMKLKENEKRVKN